MDNRIRAYRPIPGWYDLTQFKLPKDKLARYAENQILGEHYLRGYVAEHFKDVPWVIKLRQCCEEMNKDLEQNYGATQTYRKIRKCG